MESIERLRKMDGEMLVPLGNGQYVPDHSHNDIADEIEAEIAERYMELPTDADGKPIHLGDGIRIGCNKTVAAEFVGHDAVAFQHGDGLAWKLSENVRNVQNLTVEDILCELVEAVRYEQVEGAYLSDSWIADFADEIRELMAVGE